jgi:hypothetical protein
MYTSKLITVSSYDIDDDVTENRIQLVKLLLVIFYVQSFSLNINREFEYSSKIAYTSDRHSVLILNFVSVHRTFYEC